jgi:hypothetical protein
VEPPSFGVGDVNETGPHGEHGRSMPATADPAGASVAVNASTMTPGELTIPTDEVDEEMLERPSTWDIRFIERSSRVGRAARAPTAHRYPAVVLMVAAYLTLAEFVKLRFFSSHGRPGSRAGTSGSGGSIVGPSGGVAEEARWTGRPDPTRVGGSEREES